MSNRILVIAEKTATKIMERESKRQSGEFHIRSDVAFFMIKEDIQDAIVEYVRTLTSDFK